MNWKFSSLITSFDFFLLKKKNVLKFVSSKRTIRYKKCKFDLMKTTFKINLIITVN